MTVTKATAVRRKRAAAGLAALTLTVVLAAACSAEVPAPTAPSPGQLEVGGGTPKVAAPPASEGPGITSPGIRLSAVPRADGSFDVTEEVLLRGATSMVQLRPPTGDELPGLAGIVPKASNVQVTADAVGVTLTPAEVTEPRDLPLVTAATRIQLTYRLTGSTVRSVPSRSGRALAALGPLTAGTDGTLPTDLVVSGGGLLNATCPRLSETRCSVGEPPGLSIQPAIPADQAVAVLQLNLPVAP